MVKAFIHTADAGEFQQPCPVCHANLDATTGVSLDPADLHPTLALGDITLCAYCDTPLVVTTLGFRPAEAADLETLDPALRRLVFAWMVRRRSRQS